MPTPTVMKNARVDLGATVEGQFSPEDWTAILARAESEWHAQLSRSPEKGELEAWHEVMRDFRRQNNWGFRANYRPPRIPKKKNLGVTFIWMSFNTLTTMKVGVLWFGQIYSRSDE